MPDNRPRPKDRKQRLVAPLILALAVGGILLLAYVLNLNRSPAENPAPPPPQSTPAPPPAVVAPQPLGRADLIAGAQRAAAAYSAPAGASAPSGEPLRGKPFRLRIAFGCDGAVGRPLGAQAFTEYDRQSRTLKLVAQPASWTGLPLVEAIEADGRVEAIEGFWAPRPWNAAEGCPPKRGYSTAPNPTAQATQTLGLAQAFEIGGSRLLRRGDRPYEFVRRIAEADAGTLANPYWLVLEGDVVGFGGEAFRCWQESAEHQPICLLGVNFTKVAFEDAVTGQQLAEWRE